jgi:ribokinase
MTNLKTPLLVVGATIVYDYIFRVDRLPQPGRTARIMPNEDRCQSQPLPGGTAFNIALGLAKLDESVRLTHPVGHEFSGSAYERSLREAGVNLDGLLVNPQSSSGVAYVFGALDGATVCFTSVADLSQHHIPAAVLDDINLIVLTPLAGPLHQHAGEYARNKGIPLAICGIAEPETLTWLPQVLMLAINEYELQLLFNFEQGLTAHQLSERMPGYLFITQGAKGCLVFHKGVQLGYVTAIQPQQIVDTTGAGDAFFAATLAGIRNDFDPIDAARMGAAAGSMTVEVSGCQANLPNWTGLAARLSTQYPDLAAQLEKKGQHDY